MQLAKLDIATSFAAALFGAYVIVEAILYGVTSDTGPGAGTFPLVAGILILVFAIANLARTLRGAMPDALRLEGSIQLPEVARVLGTIVLIGLYIACFDKLGAFLPLPFLMDPRHHRRHAFDFEGAVREWYSMPWHDGRQERFIWGATAGMLRNLYRFLSA